MRLELYRFQKGTFALKSACFFHKKTILHTHTLKFNDNNNKVSHQFHTYREREELEFSLSLSRRLIINFLFGKHNKNACKISSSCIIYNNTLSLFSPLICFSKAVENFFFGEIVHTHNIIVLLCSLSLSRLQCL